MEKFGDIPVEMATGVPNISIPIHTLHYGNINVPIALRYHSGAVRTANHPSWVGVGWDLQAGGAITRTVRGYPDEFYGTQIMGALGSTYFPEPVASPPTCGADIVNSGPNWKTQAALASYFQPNASGQLNDVSADEFSFNCMGYSGKFYYSGTTMGWQVVCNDNVKVELTNSSSPFLTGGGVVAAIQNEYNASSAAGHLFPNSNNVWMDGATNVFSGFTLTAPDGTKYYFGSSTGAGIEFFTPYGLGGAQFEASTWLLTKIVDIDNNEVDFNYSASYPVAELGFGLTAGSWSCTVTTGGWLSNVSSEGAVGSPVYINARGGSLHLPLYLDNITCQSETVTFTRSIASCLRFSDNVYRYRNPVDPLVPLQDPRNVYALGILGDGAPDGAGGLINGVNNIQWQQLNSLSVKNGNNQTYRQYFFTYQNSAGQRQTLTAFQEADNMGVSVKKYSFLYNNMANLPLYDANFTDHWGFYNGLTLSGANTSATDGTTGSIFYLKQTIPAVVTTGLLTQINFPTGGHTEFTWQAHDYSQVVSNSRNSLVNQTGYAGGARIAEIKSMLADGTVASDKKYLYVRNYTNANHTGLTSSGILNGTPAYNITLTNRPSLHGTMSLTISSTLLNSVATYSYNAVGSYIGYDEVVELNEDGSYTRAFFTSYGPDLNGVSHWDIAPLASIGWALGDNYYPLSTIDMERGKPTGIFKYSAGDVLVEKTITTYRNDPDRFNNYIPLINFNGVYNSCGVYDALVLATSNQVFTYNYYKTSETTTTYDQNGKNPVVSSATFAYNVNNLLSDKQEISSKGESIETQYRYPPDMTDATSQAMAAAHILNPITNVTTINNGALVTANQTNYYSPTPGQYKPQYVLTQLGSYPQETRQQFYQYDVQGNIQELSKTNDIHDVYLWGYFRQYPVAKITGSTLSAVTAIVSQAQIDAATNASTATNDVTVRNLLQQLRAGLPNAQVKTYTYLPLTGITSQTDPRGRTTYYQYDAFQRLKAVIDHEGNITKTYNYQYQMAQ
jgi:YD repeat-containing protein